MQKKAQYMIDRENGLLPADQVTEPVNDDNIRDLVEFIDENLQPARCINNRHSAYGLKQPISRILGRHFFTGEFIRAMELVGFTVRRIDNGGNARFNVDSASIMAMHRKYKNLQWH